MDWIDLGGVELCVVSGGRFRLDGGAMYGVIPRVLWEQNDPPDEKHRIALDANCVVVRTAGLVAVLDTGYGNKLEPKEQEIVALEPGVTVRTAVEKLGIAPGEVNVVILSHLHMDHAGGASERKPDGSVGTTFPKARIIVRRGEWEDAEANRSTMRVSYRPENLDPLRASGQLELLDNDCEVLPGVRVELAPGHTPFHQITHLRGQNGCAVFSGDVLPTWFHTRGPYNMAYDQAPYENMMQKLKLLKMACDGRWLLITSHDSRHPTGRVVEVKPGEWGREEEAPRG